MPEVGTPNQAEREFETGSDETFKGAAGAGTEAHRENQRNLYANIKRTYDAYQDFDVQAVRQFHTTSGRINQIAEQALQNAVTTSNLANQQVLRYFEAVQQQYLRHSDLAGDSFWNPVSAGAGMNLTAGAAPANRFVDTTGAVATGAVNLDIAAVGAAVAKSIDATLTPVLATLQQVVQALAAATASIANVQNQTQPQPK